MPAALIIEREQLDFGREIVIGDNLTVEVSRQGGKYRIRIKAGGEIGFRLTCQRRVKSREKRPKS